MWSYSKITTFSGCQLKYRLNYVEKWKPTIENSSDVTLKGLAIHETLEVEDTLNTIDDIKAMLQSKNKEQKITDDVYDLELVANRIKMYKEQFLDVCRSKGDKVYHEMELKTMLNGEEFCGFIDCIVEHTDGKITVIDYKTPKGIDAERYKKQLTLYTVMYMKIHGYDLSDIGGIAKIKVFFPLGKTKTEDLSEMFIEIPLDVNLAKETIDYLFGEIEAIKNFDWKNAEPNISFSCKWCPYAGAMPNSNGFCGCVASSLNGNYQPIGQTYVKPEEKAE